MPDNPNVSNEPMTVAVTGATGFIGQVLCRKLLAAGFKVRALYRSHPVAELQHEAGIEWIQGSLGDHSSLQRLLSGSNAIVHCAGAVRGANRAAFDPVNVEGTRAVVEAANNDAGCRRFMLLSSLAAREPQLSDYAASKAAGEQELKSKGTQLEWGIIRPPAVYGPGDKEMLPVFKSMVKGWVPVPGTARGRLSLIYVEDLANAIISWLQSDSNKCVNSSFEIDDGQQSGYDWNMLLTLASESLERAPIRRLSIPLWMLRLVGKINLAAAKVFKYAPMLTPGKVRELTHPDWVCHDNLRFEEATAWRPTITFNDGLLKTLKYSSVI